MISLQRAEQAKLDQFQNASNTCYLYGELEGFQEQQEEEEEEEEQGPLVGTATPPYRHAGPCLLQKTKKVK